MQVSRPNEHGVLEAGHREIVASHGRAYCAISIALCEDGLFRYGVDLMYSYGGVFTPIRAKGDSYPGADAARTAALNELLRHWHTPFPSDPASVQEELRRMREQIEAHLIQPLVF